jgi:hypothetical protein
MAENSKPAMIMIKRRKIRLMKTPQKLTFTIDI